jgi:hypothetical protein
MDISQFPLAWRWTDEQYAVLPADVLAQIAPQTPEQARALFDESLTLTGDDGLSPALFSLKQIGTEHAEPSQIAAWLLERHPETQTQVYLSWQPDTAVLTNWCIFAKYWDEFCYPASDDLIVLPTDRRWALLYHHSEFMQHGLHR